MPGTITATTTELPESRVRVEAEVSAAEVDRRLQQTASRLGRTLRVPGFRKGKVPPPVVIRRLGRDYVLDEALRDALGGWYVDAIEVAGIAPVGDPRIDVGEPPAEGQPLAFSIEVGVRPVAKLGSYEGIEVPRREPVADDAAIEAELARLQDRLATLETVERAAEQGDFVVIDYVGRLDGEPFEGGEGRDQLLELGSGRLIPGFEEQLVGASAGEERLVAVSFPDDYGAEQLAGRPAEFAVKVGEVKAKRLPELDDEFAADAAGFDTLSELREDIAARLREYEEHEIGHEFERDVLDAVAAGAEIEVPPELIRARAEEMVEETLEQLSRQGISRERYLEIAGQTEQQLAEDAEPEAERSLRRESVIAAVVDAKAIVPTDAELLEALRPTAERSQTTAPKLLARLGDRGRLERVRRELAQRQAVELLVAEAKPVAPGAAEKPTKPAKSATPAKSAKPTKPTSSAKPAKPAAAGRATKRAKPAKPTADDPV